MAAVGGAALPSVPHPLPDRDRAIRFFDPYDAAVADSEHAPRLRERRCDDRTRGWLPPLRAENDDVDVQIRPNRKLFFFGIAAAVVGLIVIVVLVASGGSRLKDNDGIAVGSDPAGSAETGSAVAVTPPRPAPVDDNITIHVGSQPKGADVLIAGTKVGVTPFEGKLKRGATVTTLVVRMTGYAEFDSKIDLSGEYSNDNITLAKLEPKPEVRPPVVDDTTAGSDDEHEARYDRAQDRATPRSTRSRIRSTSPGPTHVATPVVHNPVHNPVPHTNPPVNTSHEHALARRDAAEAEVPARRSDQSVRHELQRQGLSALELRC